MVKTDFHKRSSRRKGYGMTSPYVCLPEVDDLGPDDSVIDYAFISEDKFLLVLLLISNGELHALWEVGNEKSKRQIVSLRSLLGSSIDPLTICLAPDASFLAVGLAEGDILVIPMKNVLDVSWGADHAWLRSSPLLITVASDRDALLAIPTCTVCFHTKNPKRATVVMTNKGGSIFLIDLESRKCVAELTAPQSIHCCQIIQGNDSTDLLVSGFTGAQWIIPLENGGRGYVEVLSSCIPSEFKQVEPASSHLSLVGTSLLSLDSEAQSVQVYSSPATLGTSVHKKYHVPPETWLCHSTNTVLFSVSKQTDVKGAVHFGIPSSRLEFFPILPLSDWRILSFVTLWPRPLALPSCLIINERGVVRVQQDANCSLSLICSEFLLHSPVFSPVLLQQVVAAAHLDLKYFKASLLPNLLTARKSRRIPSVEISRLLAMAKTLEFSMEQLLDLFSRSDHEETLLPELLRLVETDRKSSLRSRVVHLYAKKCISVKERDDYSAYKQKKDGELSAFLSRHSDISDGLSSTLSVPLWRSSLLLSRRLSQGSKVILEKVISDGETMWNEADPSSRTHMLSCVCQLPWCDLPSSTLPSLISLLCQWQRQLAAPAFHELCLRAAFTNQKHHPPPCRVLYLISAFYLLGSNHDSPTSCGPMRSVSCGQNCTIAVAEDERIMLWGDMSGQSGRRPIRPADVVPLKSARRQPSQDDPSPQKNSKTTQLPRHFFLPARPHSVSCGTEHALVLCTNGHVYSWGANRFGQCGLGHTQPVSDPKRLSGLPPIRSISAGQFHSAFLDHSGRIFVCGWGLYGQLARGQRSTDNYSNPVEVEGIGEEITSVSCGRVHTVILTKSGRIMMSGGGSYGQTGSSEDIRKVYQFEPVDCGEHKDLKFSHVCTRFYHSLAVSVDGRLFEWGRNPQEVKMKMFVMRKLRNAHRNNTDSPGKKPSHTLPRELPRDDFSFREVLHLLDSPVSHISTGLSHSAIVTQNGSLFTWGKSLEHQLGHGNKTERSEPHQLFEPTETQWNLVECGGNHCVAMSVDGRVFCWGQNDSGQCGVTSGEKTTSSPRKYFYQAKEGTKRCVQLPDDSIMVLRPSLVTEVQVRAKQDEESDVSGFFTSEKLLSCLKMSDLATLQAVSLHFSPSSPPSSSPSSSASVCVSPPPSPSLPLALCHLMAGRVAEALEQIRLFVQTHQAEPSASLTSMCSLALEVLANQEDCQSKSLLTQLFRHIPMTSQQRNSSQIRNLWPNVWDQPGCQTSLSPEEKLSMLEGWTASVRTGGRVEIPGASLRIPSSSSSTRLRLFSSCSHVEQASVGVASSECSTCAEEWRDKVMATLGNR